MSPPRPSIPPAVYAGQYAPASRLSSPRALVLAAGLNAGLSVGAEPAPERRAPPGVEPGAIELGNGRRVERAGRGVYWHRYTVHGLPVAYAIDSCGDIGSRWVTMAPGMDPDEVERRLWARLDEDDPPKLRLER